MGQWTCGIYYHKNLCAKIIHSFKEKYDEIHSYLGFTDLPLTDIGSNGQNLQPPTHFLYISVTTGVSLILNTKC